MLYQLYKFLIKKIEAGPEGPANLYNKEGRRVNIMILNVYKFVNYKLLIIYQNVIESKRINS